MNISVDIKNVDLGTKTEITDVNEQVDLLCKAIAHADDRDGAEVRALTKLAIALTGDGDAIEGVRLLLNAAAVAAHGIGLDVDEAMETLEDNMELCAQVEAENPRTS